MKSNVVVASIFGSLAVYTAMVACSTADDVDLSGGSGGHAGKDAGDIIDALADAMPQAAADPISGTRLKAKFQLNEDGSKAYLPGVWYDSQRKEDCTFLDASDGLRRCIPLTPPYVAANTNNYFLDASCTTPLVVQYYGSGCALKYIYETEVGACPAPTKYRFFMAGAKISQATIYQKSGMMCLPMSPSPSYDYYAIGNEIPPSSFVAGTLMNDP